MTRIIAGRARGRSLTVPAGARPTTDRVREALFSSITSRVRLEDAPVLDLYAGSGALGLEALSRGAPRALFVESQRAACKVLRANVGRVGLPGADVRCSRVEAVLRGPSPHRFGLVFLDPPYEAPTAEVEADLRHLVAGEWLSPDCLVVVERSARTTPLGWPPPLATSRSTRYGDTILWFAAMASDADKPPEEVH